MAQLSRRLDLHNKPTLSASPVDVSSDKLSFEMVEFQLKKMDRRTGVLGWRLQLVLCRVDKQINRHEINSHKTPPTAVNGEKLTVPKLVKIFCTFYESRMFITVFKTAHNFPYPQPHTTSSHPPRPS